MRIKEKYTELDECYKKAAINKEDNLLWFVFKKTAIHMQRIEILQRVKGRACVTWKLLCFFQLGCPVQGMTLVCKSHL